MKRTGFLWSLAAVAMIVALIAAADPGTAYSQGAWAVYVMNADGSDVQKVHLDNASLFGSPVWLSDGKQIAYDGGPNGFSNSHIFIQRLGDDAVKDIGQGNTPSFSPDDQQVAFLVGADNPSGAKAGVWIMNADGSSREWICQGSRPRWSRDGDKIVFTSSHEGFPSLYVYDTLLLEQTRILGRGYDQIIGAAFSPDASQVVFIGYKGGQTRSSSTDAEGDVALLDVRRDAEPEVVYRGRVGWHPDWSPQGKKLLFRIHENGAQRLHILDLDDDGRPIAVPGQFGRRNSDGVWSPDGKRILFVSDRG